MSDLRESWSAVSERVTRARHLLLLLDFDGTIVPIVERPRLARLPDEARRLLAGLRDLPGVELGFVSGRALEDLVSKVLLERVWYVGNHGFEVRSPSGEDTRFFEPGDIVHLDVVREEIERATTDIPGVLLEPKGPVLAVHFRQVPADRTRDVERIFFEVVGRHHTRLQIGYGKAVLEARLRAPCTKGSAVRFIRRRAANGALPLYFGDDRTDQYAFRELWGTGVSVGVGRPAPPLSDYTLPDPEAVVASLERLSAELRGRRA
jgi:trehalose-phosphatase